MESLLFKEEKPILSNFTSSENIIKIFEEYKFELTNDGYLEFGMAYYDDSVMNEIYVASYKYIKVWTTNIDLIDKTLNSFGIQQVDNLHFIDEFPVVSEALEANAKLGIKHYSEVFACINQQFDEL